MRKNGQRLYWVWAAMVQRCTNTRTAQFENYGGRGITVCDDWNKSANFILWAMRSGYKQGLTIDRIDNDKGYSPNNCRWITRAENAKNKGVYKNSPLGVPNIETRSYKGKISYRVRIRRNGVLVVNKTIPSFIEAKAIRDDFYKRASA